MFEQRNKMASHHDKWQLRRLFQPSSCFLFIFLSRSLRLALVRTLGSSLLTGQPRCVFAREGNYCKDAELVDPETALTSRGQ